MKVVRMLLVTLAAATLLGALAVVGLAAPGAILRAGGPNASATQAEYCPAGEREARAAAVKRYQRQLAANQRKFFRSNRSKGARKAFVKKQQAQLQALKRALARCD